MADISKVTLPDNSQYNLKDAQARTQLTSIQNHIVFSKTQPAASAQASGDVWVIISEFTDS